MRRENNMLVDKSEGFTLVELMITMLLVGFITTAIYSAYVSMQRSYVAQEQVAEMQQNLRAAIDVMVRGIRMAGYDPTGKAKAGFVAPATAGRLHFTNDTTNNAGTAADGDGVLTQNEHTTFLFLRDINGVDTDGNDDGIADTGAATFGRLDGAGLVPEDLAENIVAVEFNYIMKDGTTTLAPLAGQLGDIRSVQISMLARAGNPDPNHRDTRSYVTGAGIRWGGLAGFNDNYRRRLMITTVQCRNLGL